MRLLSLVVTLLLVAFLVYKQMGPNREEPAQVSVDGVKGEIATPVRPEDLPDFQKKLNQRVLDQADDTARQVNEAIQ